MGAFRPLWSISSVCTSQVQGSHSQIKWWSIFEGMKAYPPRSIPFGKTAFDLFSCESSAFCELSSFQWYRKGSMISLSISFLRQRSTHRNKVSRFLIMSSSLSTTVRVSKAKCRIFSWPVRLKSLKRRCCSLCAARSSSFLLFSSSKYFWRATQKFLSCFVILWKPRYHQKRHNKYAIYTLYTCSLKWLNGSNKCLNRLPESCVLFSVVLRW